MSIFVFSNFLNTTLSAAASSTDTTLTLASSANLPTLQSGQVMPLFLNDAATGQIYEVVYVTAISGATLTVERGKEGTTAQNWSVGDYAYSKNSEDTTGTPQGVLQPTGNQTLPNGRHVIVQPNLSAAATLTLPQTGNLVGDTYEVYGSAYAVTVNTGVTTGSPSLNFPDQSSAYSWAIAAGDTDSKIVAVWDGLNWRCVTVGQTIVAAATQSNEAVNLGQAQSTFALPPVILQPTASETLPNGRHVIVQPNLSAAATITLPQTGSQVGDTYEVYGSAYAVTVNTGVTTGSPSLNFPDQSSAYSWAIAANDTVSKLVATWDGANWRCVTFGQTIVAAATQSNEAVNLGQFSSSLGTSGWKKYPDPNSPSGYFIEQWLTLNYGGGANVNTYTMSGNWPIAFPNAVLSTSTPAGSRGFGTNWGQFCILNVNPTTTGISFQVTATNNSSYTTKAQTFYVMAIGY